MLASRFTDIAVYFTSPKGVQSSAFSDFCPSVVLECGQSSDSSGVDHALAYLETVLAMDDLSSHNSNGLKLYHTVARVLIPKTITIGNQVGAGSFDICLNRELDDKNFHQISPGTEFAMINPDTEKPLVVSSESDEDVTDEYMEVDNNRLVFKKPVTLSMFTRSEKAIRQDCVCYFMEELYIG